MRIETIIKQKLEEQGYEQVFYICGSKELYFSAIYIPEIREYTKKAKKVELKVEQREDNKFVACEFIKNIWSDVAEIMMPPTFEHKGAD